jgi:tyrosine-protein kinase Etk/Wzc
VEEAKIRREAGIRQIDEDEISLLDYAAVIRRRWSMIGGLCLVVLGATTIGTVIQPRIYESTAALLTPKEGIGTGLFGGIVGSGLVQQMPGTLLPSPPSLTPNRDMLFSILKSRTLARAVVDRFGLQDRYRARYLEDAITRLQGQTEIRVSREGVIFVTVEDIDPQVAAQMANFYVEQLDRLIAQLGTSEGARQRAFITKQLAQAKTDLEASEGELRRFQERNRAISLQDQTRGAIEIAARLKGEVMAAEVQLEVMRNFATEANPEMVLLRRRIDEMKRHLAQLQYGDGRVSGDRRDFAVPFPKVPEVGIELVRLTRDVKVGETLVTLLIQQLEQAKTAEAKDLPTVQVLDRAVPAERHSKPKLLLNVGLALVVGLLAGVFLAFFLEYVRNARFRPRPA